MPVNKLNGEGRRILVVDDDLAIRVLLQAVLRRMNFDVELAEDGAAGLERLENSRAGFDLVLLDLMMPRLNGYEFIEQAATAAGGKSPHIVVFTAAGKRGIEKIPSANVCNSILKPFDLDRFIEIIAECVASAHAAPRSGAMTTDEIPSATTTPKRQ